MLAHLPALAADDLEQLCQHLRAHKVPRLVDGHQPASVDGVLWNGDLECKRGCRLKVGDVVAVPVQIAHEKDVLLLGRLRLGRVLGADTLHGLHSAKREAAVAHAHRAVQRRNGNLIFVDALVHVIVGCPRCTHPVKSEERVRNGPQQQSIRLEDEAPVGFHRAPEGGRLEQHVVIVLGHRRHAEVDKLDGPHVGERVTNELRILSAVHDSQPPLRMCSEVAQIGLDCGGNRVVDTCIYNGSDQPHARPPSATLACHREVDRIGTHGPCKPRPEARQVPLVQHRLETAMEGAPCEAPRGHDRCVRHRAQLFVGLQEDLQRAGDDLARICGQATDSARGHELSQAAHVQQHWDGTGAHRLGDSDPKVLRVRRIGAFCRLLPLTHVRCLIWRQCHRRVAHLRRGDGVRISGRAQPMRHALQVVSVLLEAG
mmetsp:Transcript_8544/g.25294  ORF Transcript_8544/g.25294 Transcript_8544/m.25294 type:complete len:428 (+) Transcript_8544:414-1697(+)